MRENTEVWQYFVHRTNTEVSCLLHRHKSAAISKERTSTLADMRHYWRLLVLDRFCRSLLQVISYLCD
jgi:hypothetical protein